MGRKGHLIMPTIKQLEEQGRALQEDQKNLVLDESRPGPRSATSTTVARPDIKAVIEQRNAQKAVDGDPFAGRPEPEEPDRTETRSFGRQVTDSDDYKAMVAGKAKAGRSTSRSPRPSTRASSPPTRVAPASPVSSTPPSSCRASFRSSSSR
jgi:hypothetical protein